jgi:adenine-specific DNA methylase
MDLASSNCRLIELSIPLDTTSAQSAWEKPIRHGQISALHIWWARPLPRYDLANRDQNSVT